MSTVSSSCCSFWSLVQLQAIVAIDVLLDAVSRSSLWLEERFRNLASNGQVPTGLSGFVIGETAGDSSKA